MPRVPRWHRWQRAIILNKQWLLPCSAHLTGQYGIDDLYIGVPIKLGGNGVEEIIEIELTNGELKSLQHFATPYREGICVVGVLDSPHHIWEES